MSFVGTSVCRDGCMMDAGVADGLSRVLQTHLSFKAQRRFETSGLEWTGTVRRWQYESTKQRQCNRLSHFIKATRTFENSPLFKRVFHSFFDRSSTLITKLLRIHLIIPAPPLQHCCNSHSISFCHSLSTPSFHHSIIRLSVISLI